MAPSLHLRGSTTRAPIGTSRSTKKASRTRLSPERSTWPAVSASLLAVRASPTTWRTGTSAGRHSKRCASSGCSSAFLASAAIGACPQGAAGRRPHADARGGATGRVQHRSGRGHLDPDRDARRQTDGSNLRNHHLAALPVTPRARNRSLEDGRPARRQNAAQEQTSGATAQSCKP